MENLIKKIYNIKYSKLPHYVIPGKEITKKKRLELLETITVSGSNSMLCEHYQRQIIEEGTGSKCSKSNGIRINEETNKLGIIRNPYSGPDASYEWTEDFDGIQKLGNYIILYNFKFIVEAGGSQTRTLKNVYSFVKAQKKIEDKKFLFVNILDGQMCSLNMGKFSCFDEDETIYVGDSYNFFSWLDIKLETIK